MPDRARGAPRPATRAPHRRHRVARREEHRHAGDGQCGHRGVGAHDGKHGDPRSKSVARSRATRRPCTTFSTPQAQAGTLQMPLPSVELWRKRLSDVSATDYLLVAEVDGAVVGNLGLHAASTSPRRKHAASIGMSVHDDWHNRGVGSALMSAALDIADNWHNYLRPELTVYTDNAAALRLYRNSDSRSRVRSRTTRFATAATSTRTRWRGCAAQCPNQRHLQPRRTRRERRDRTFTGRPPRLRENANLRDLRAGPRVLRFETDSTDKVMR